MFNQTEVIIFKFKIQSFHVSWTFQPSSLWQNFLNIHYDELVWT
jgi:hypothetical protein